MRNKAYNNITINSVDYSNYLRLPLMVQKSLDEQLDFAVVELFNTPIKEQFKPFSAVSVGSMDFILSDDQVQERVGAGLYKHTITLIEETKEAERIICGAKAFTNPLVRDYTEGQTLIYGRETSAVIDRDSAEGRLIHTVDPAVKPQKSKYYLSPVTGSIPLWTDFGVTENKVGFDLFYCSIYRNRDASPIMWIEYGKKFEIRGDLIREIEIINSDPDNVLTPAVGDVLFGTSFDLSPGYYLIQFALYSYDDFNGNQIGDPYYSSVAEFVVANEATVKPPYTIEQVINILLSTAEPLRDGLDAPRYTLSYTEKQAEKMRQNAPEFHFSNGRSLWENLREIGRYIHAIPRLIGNTLVFDDLGDTEYADLSKGRLIAKTSAYSIGDYTAGLESFANNLVNLDDEDDGSISEPWDAGFVTMRAASEEARIEEGTGIVKLHFPIEKVLKLEIGAFEYGGDTYQPADITPYLFEKSEYDLLYTASGPYPDSRTFAIYYTKGGTQIEGFWYKAADSGSAIIDSFEQYSLVNIIERATGVNTGYFSQLDYTNLTFRVTYIPSINARLRQYKPTYDGDFPSLVAYNQSANKLSARAFGENLRGQLAMMANTTDTVMYMFPRLDDVPSPGELYDHDRYISSIACRIYPDFVIAQMSLSVGYNELGAYVETNNAIRQFEIPASEDRYVILDEFCFIGEKGIDDLNTAATGLKEQVRRAFSSDSPCDVSLALVNTYDEGGGRINDVTLALPTMSLAIGNSLYFGFRFEDNFSAGSQSVDGGEQYRYQEHVPYGDAFYSRARAIDFKLVTGAQITGDIEDAANALPEASGLSTGTAMVNVSQTYPLIVEKDSADALCITYQMHFMSKDYIIGDGLAYHCPAIRKKAGGGQAYIYFYDHRINQLTGTTDTDNYIARYPVYSDDEKIYHDGSPSGFASWAIIKDGKFMLGKNTDKLTNEIYFTFKRRLNE